MTIVIAWYWFVIVLFIIPFVYYWFNRRPRHAWDFGIDIVLCGIVSWTLALGILLGHVFTLR